MHNYIRDINSKLSRVGIVLIDKPWESKMLNQNVFALKWKHDRASETNNFHIEKKWRQALYELKSKLKAYKPYLLFTRISSLNREAKMALEDNDFTLIERYLEMQHDLKLIPSLSNNNVIRLSVKSDLLMLEKVAYESFRYSRFHNDPQIRNVVANRTRSEWLKESFHGRSDFILVAETDQKVTGFLVCRKESSANGVKGIIDLMAVPHSYKRRKVGYDLTAEFLKYCKERHCDIASVGTQVKNIPAVRLYEKTGFVLHKSYYTYHMHVRDQI